jgi:hypothetical protein
MLNRYYRGGNTYNSTEVYQQPNDAADAARLYGEIEAKALEKFKETVCQQIEGIQAQFVTAQLVRSPLEWKDTYLIFFKLNGKACEARVSVSASEAKQLDEIIYKEIAEAVTAEVLRSLYPSLLRR